MKRFNGKVQDAYIQFKSESRCCVCGYQGNPAAICFHHVEAESKSGLIGKFVKDKDYYGLLQEMNKCVIMCSNCHNAYHNSCKQEQVTVEELFVRVDIDKFIQTCYEYNAINYDDTVELDSAKRIDMLQERIEILEKILLTTTCKNESTLDEDAVVEAFKVGRTLSRTTQLIFGQGKRGAYYNDKVVPILIKHGMIHR